MSVKAPSFVDAEAALHEWGNSRTDLVGPGRPVPLGFRFQQPESRRGATLRGVFALVEILGGDGNFVPEGGTMRARLSVRFIGDTRESCSRAAVAYCRALESIRPAADVRVQDGEVRVAFADGIAGPSFTTFEDQTQYLVDCDLYLQVIVTPPPA